MTAEITTVAQKAQVQSGNQLPPNLRQEIRFQAKRFGNLASKLSGFWPHKTSEPFPTIFFA